MRGEDMHAEHLFSYVRLETRIPTDHPLRAIRELVDAALKDLSRSFDRLYSREGRPSIPPERLLRALLLQAFYTVRSERQLMEQLDYNLLFRWFVGALRAGLLGALRLGSRRRGFACSQDRGPSLLRVNLVSAVTRHWPW
jgi:hypothetical protein